MARKAQNPIEKRMLKGSRVAAVLAAYEIPLDQFLMDYDTVTIDRKSKWDDVEALKRRVAELTGELAQHAA